MSGIQELVNGFKRFRKKFYQDSGLLSDLARNGIHPDRLVVNCPDARNGADLVFDAKPGDQFLNPMVGAIVPPYEKGAFSSLEVMLDFAVGVKKVPELVVMSHSDCAGIAALREKAKKEPDLHAPLVELVRKAEERAVRKVGTRDQDKLGREVERQVAVLSMANLLEYPAVKRAVTAGDLKIDVLYFDLEQGSLHEFEPDTNSFEPLVGPSVRQKVAMPHQCHPSDHRNFSRAP